MIKKLSQIAAGSIFHGLHSTLNTLISGQDNNRDVKEDEMNSSVNNILILWKKLEANMDRIKALILNWP